MGFLSEWTVMPHMRLAQLPGKIDFDALMRAKEFHMASFDIAENTPERKDRFDIPGKTFDRFFKCPDAFFQVIFFFRKPIGALGRADQLMHKKRIVGAAIGLLFVLEMFQPLFKLGEKRISFLEGKSFSFFLVHRSKLLTG